MLPNPTERNVNLLLFQTGIRTVKKLVLTLAIHDKNVTMTKAARASITARTGLALPSEERLGTEAHRHNELLSPPSLSQTAAHHRSTSLPAISIPGKGSGSQQLAHLPQHTTASSGVR